MTLDDLYTPCLVLDRMKLISNTGEMRRQAEKLGVILRPHVKTAKSIEVAKYCSRGRIAPITVSTLREAEYFADAGYTDIIYAVSMVPHKLPRAAALIERGVDLKLIVDSSEMAQAITDAGEQSGHVYKVMIEIDVDMHRAGLSPDDPLVIKIARILAHGNGTEMAGVLTHAGESYECSSEEELISAAENERAKIVEASKRIRTAKIPCPIVSCGSTPTATFAQDLTGVTEMRAGIFVFQDLFQAGVGSCTNEDIALTVLTTVISHKKNQNRIITDAGGMALSKDRSTQGTDFDSGYGLVADQDGKIIENLYVLGANQEHGLITTIDGSDIDFDKFPIGSRLRILPNHSCMTAGAYDTYNIVDSGQEIVETWERCNGW